MEMMKPQRNRPASNKWKKEKEILQWTAVMHLDLGWPKWTKEEDKENRSSPNKTGLNVISLKFLNSLDLKNSNHFKFALRVSGQYLFSYLFHSTHESRVRNVSRQTSSVFLLSNFNSEPVSCHFLQMSCRSPAAATHQSHTTRLQCHQWGVRAPGNLVEFVSEELINFAVSLTVFSETCTSLENS